MDRKYWENFHKQLRNISEKTRVTLYSEKIGEGTFSNVYRLEDDKKTFSLVAKISKRPSNQDYNEALEKAHTSAYAQILAKIFRKVTYNIDHAPPLFYLSPFVYTLDTPFNGVKHFYAEPEIDMTNSDWVKYTNNFAACQDAIMGAFSHFSYQATHGYLLLSDVQGLGTVLSDPAIHC